MNWLKKAQYEIIIAFTTSVGCFFAFLAIQKLSKMYAIFVAMAFTIILVFLILRKIQADEEKTKHESESREHTKEKHKLEKALAKERQESLFVYKDEALNLLNKANEYSTSIMRLLSENLQNIQKQMRDGSLEFSRISISNRISEFKIEIIQLVLERLKMLFEGDTRGVKDTSLPHTYFKVALFEIKRENGKLFLDRTFYVYPDGIEPGEKTGWVEIEESNRCAHVLSYLKERLIILEDIPSESEKNGVEARWRDLRHNQSSEYKSMFCVPIVKGKRGAKEREILAILVVDTNRERYFKEHSAEYKAFFGAILNPFRTLLTIAFDIENYRGLLTNKNGS